MISVVVYINNQPIIARAARNTGQEDKSGRTIYKVDDGRTILHQREDGAAKLAIAMLKAVKAV